MMWYGDGWGHMGAWGWVGMLFMLLFWFGLIALIVWAIGNGRAGMTPTTSEGRSGDHALAILRERFVRGELTSEEYEQARKTLDETHR
jgi:putative membrane protein